MRRFGARLNGHRVSPFGERSPGRCGCFAPLQSLAHEPSDGLRRMVCRPPLNWIFVKPGHAVGQTPAKPDSSGRHAVLLGHNNTLNISRASLGAADTVPLDTTTRCACLCGRQSLAHEPAAHSRIDRRGSVGEPQSRGGLWPSLWLTRKATDRRGKHGRGRECAVCVRGGWGWVMVGDLTAKSGRPLALTDRHGWGRRVWWRGESGGKRVHPVHV
jgi:hypothetical protein